MTTRTRLGLIVAMIACLILGPSAAYAQRRAGGARVSAARSGRGSVRHTPSRSTRPSSRPSTRPTTRPSTRPSTRPTQRPTTRPATRPSTRPTTRPTVQRPANAGSIRHARSAPGAAPARDRVAASRASGTPVRDAGQRVGRREGTLAGRDTAIAARGGRDVISQLPADARPVNLPNRRPCYRHGYRWYRPYYRGTGFVYVPVYPEVGYYYDDLPENYETVTVDDEEYYYADGVYYEDDGDGYAVADEPGLQPGEAEVVSSSDLPDPFETLEAMAGYMGALDDFAITTDSEQDVALESGQTITVHTRRTVTVDRSGQRLAVIVQSDDRDMRGLYDDGLLTILCRDQNMYVELDMPVTLDGMLDTLAEEYGFAPPMSDFLYSDMYSSLTSRTLTGQYVGKVDVGLYECDHLAFTEAGVDWEIWIRTGDKPIPQKFAITYRDQPGAPRYTSELSRFEDAPGPLAFELNIPNDAEKVDMTPMEEDDFPDAPN